MQTNLDFQLLSSPPCGRETWPFSNVECQGLLPDKEKLACLDRREEQLACLERRRSEETFGSLYGNILHLSNSDIDIKNSSDLTSLVCIPPLTSSVHVENCPLLREIVIDCDINTFSIKGLPSLKKLEFDISININFRVVDCESLQYIKLGNGKFFEAEAPPMPTVAAAETPYQALPFAWTEGLERQAFLSPKEVTYSRVYINNCKNLESVLIEGSIIEDITIIDCEKIESVNFNSNSERLIATFNNCKNLKSCLFPEKINELLVVKCPNICINNLKSVKKLFSDIEKNQVLRRCIQ
mgnify:CR=1 FL=1